MKISNIFQNFSFVKKLVFDQEFDFGGQKFNYYLEKQSKKIKNFYFFKSLGKKSFLSLLKKIDLIINLPTGVHLSPSLFL